MNEGLFARYLRRVTVVHLLIALAIVTAGLWAHLLRRKREVLVPVEFLVEVPIGDSVDVPEPPEVKPGPKETVPETRPEDVSEPVTPPKIKIKPPDVKPPEVKPPEVKPPEVKPPEVKPPEAKPPEVKPPGSKPKIVVTPSRTRIVRFGIPQGSPRPTLSEAEVRRLLDLGATPSDRTSIPGDDQMGFAMIRKAFYDVWIQPSREEAGDAVVKASIALAPDGWITGRRVIAASGISGLDDSVQQALNAVSRIEGLPKGFGENQRAVTVVFKVE